MPLQSSLLRPHQVAPVQELLGVFSHRNAAVDLSDCGTGKTFVACAVAHELKTPTLVVCPKIAQTQWQQAAEHFGDTISVVGYEKLRTGRTPYGSWENPPTDGDRDYWQCACCQLRVDIADPRPCYAHNLGIHCLVRKQRPWKYGRFSFHPAVETVVFDEIQKCGSLDSLNADMLIAAKRQGRRILGLSATLASSPLQLRAIGYVLGFFPQPSQWAQWARRYKVRYNLAFHGYHWFASEAEQSQIMASIRDTILPEKGVRVTVAEILGFPEVDISAELYDLEESGQIQKIYEEMSAALLSLSEKSADSPLTLQLRACQKAELLKVLIAVELAQDYIEKGFSIGIFVNFKQTMECLRQRLNCDCFIDGSPDGQKYRQRNIDSFQANKEKLILINSLAGGVGLSLPDLDGDHPRGGLVFPGYSATTLKQVFGRFPRESSKSRSFYKVLLAAKTGDVKIQRALRSKMNNLDALNDADLLPNNLTLSEDGR